MELDVRGLALAPLRLGLTAASVTADAMVALPRIATSLEQLSAAVSDVRRLLADDNARDDVASLREALVRLSDAAGSIRPLADTVNQLSVAVASLDSTVSPLQGATERLGRLVDRLPSARRRAIDVEPG